MAAKYQQLAGMLRSELRQLAQQGTHKLATEAELCARYHMSRQTVRHALKLLEEEGLIQRRRGSGSYLTKKEPEDRLRQTAILVAFPDSYLSPALVHDVRRTLGEAGYTTQVYATGDRVQQEREILSTLLSQDIRGILVEGVKTALPSPNTDLYQALADKGVSVVFCGSPGSLAGAPCLTDDGYSGGYLLGRHLLAQGRTSIAAIFQAGSLQGQQRYHGLISALRDSAVPILEDSILWYNPQDTEQLLARRRPDLLDRFLQDQLPGTDTVVCQNDALAHHLIRRLLEAGKRVPQEVAVVSFDNSYYSQIGPVPITSLGHTDLRPGAIAGRLLLDAMEGKHPESITLGWKLFPRDSG